MKNLLIISDTHKDIVLMASLIKKYKDFQIIHCGDYCIDYKYLEENNIIYVDGNCDNKNNVLERVIECDGKKIFITHGHKYSVKSGLEKLYFKALELDVDYVFFGHTHNPLNIEYNGIYFINPGSLKYTNTYVTIEDDVIKIKEI